MGSFQLECVRHRLRLPKQRLPASGPHSGETAGAVASAFLWISHRQEAGSSGVGIQQHRHSAGCSAGWEVPNHLPSEQPQTAWFPSARNLCVGHCHSQSSLDQGAGNLKFGCLSLKGGLDIRIGQPLLTRFLEFHLTLLWGCKRSRQGPHRVAGHGIPRRGGFPEAGGCRVVQVGRCSPEGLAPRQIP